LAGKISKFAARSLPSFGHYSPRLSRSVERRQYSENRLSKFRPIRPAGDDVTGGAWAGADLAGRQVAVKVLNASA
jgi:hypothetical protein